MLIFISLDRLVHQGVRKEVHSGVVIRSYGLATGMVQLRLYTDILHYSKRRSTFEMEMRGTYSNHR